MTEYKLDKYGWKLDHKHFTTLKSPTCPICEEDLLFIEEGIWHCKDCKYALTCNISECIECNRLTLCEEENRYNPYCNIPNDDGVSCSDFAKAEADQDDNEHSMIMEHVKNHPRGCPCFICVHY